MSLVLANLSSVCRSCHAVREGQRHAAARRVDREIFFQVGRETHRTDFASICRAI